MDPTLPVIPTSLVEVDIVQQWRDGVPGAVPVHDGESGPDLASAAERFEVDISVLRAVGASASAGEVRALPLSDGRFGWAVGVGAGSAAQWRTAGAALARAVRGRLDQVADSEDETGDLGEAGDSDYLQVRLPAEVDGDVVTALTLGLSLGGYRFRVTSRPRPPRLRKVLLVAPDGADRDELAEHVRRAAEWSAATALARDLANAPSNIKDPAWLTGVGAELATDVPGLSATVRDEKWLADRGFGGVLAVGGGSARPPRLLELSYRPEHHDGPHLVLVGKGITFDTGGISLKPAEGMHLMRTDMSGGAAVIAALLSIARLRLPVRVTGLVPAAENHVSGSAYRPGDVVRHYGGKTTEVGNTDAEGRMVLADAMAYAVEQHEPDLLVDVATLTGAMKVALGLRTGGFFATDDELAGRVSAAGERVGEAWWRMPLLDAHAEDVKGTLADVKQTPPGPGGVTAALFLREFTGGLPWAHLDIAGPARAESDYAEVVAGATGFAARSLVELAAGFTG
ncbi:leucyl aminopeptidase family protein [Saccharopolyspora rosea]|uniref:Probable cytosol aminopeptidase n=1 Tax=Saccharopolyspora rosea TaxID=524884 RepID=A0ABW3FN04_9PSEU|nr:leucyl aminopeptidase family protein [Saccharopolyspora rosea]